MADTLDGYEEWLDELEALPWWEALDRAFEREMTNRLAAAKDRLREEGNACEIRISNFEIRVEGSGDRDPDARPAPAA